MAADNEYNQLLSLLSCPDVAKDVVQGVAAALAVEHSGTSVQKGSSMYTPRYIQSETSKQGYKLRGGDAVLLAQHIMNLAASPAAVPAVSAPSEYAQCLKRLPRPPAFGSCWPDWQDTSPPMFYNGRPHTARSTSASLMFEGFGTFLENIGSLDLDAKTCQLTLKLTRLMSRSYMDTSNKSCTAITRRYFGEDHQGSSRGKERLRAQELRDLLLELMRFKMDTYVNTVEPSSTSDDGDAETDGSWRIRNSEGAVIAQGLIMEVTEDFNSCGASNPGMQMLGCYAKLVGDRWQSPAVAMSCYPALGLEVIGDCMRLHALYLTDRICCEPLTPYLHLMDERRAVPGYTEHLARVLKSMMVLLEDIYQHYEPFTTMAGQVTPTARDAELEAGVPYMLRRRFSAVQQLQPPKHMYLCTTSSAQHIAKVVPGQYPIELHESAAAKGILPRLLSKPQHIPGANGGFWLVEMELLSRGDGWMHLADFLGDVDAVEEKAMDVLQQLHSCLEGRAVHGDVRSANIMIRPAHGVHQDRAGDTSASSTTSTGRYELMLLDIDTGGMEGCARYPLFLNPALRWAIDQPDGKPITQEHDRVMMQRAVDHVRRRVKRRQRQLPRPSALPSRVVGRPAMAPGLSYKR